MSNLGKTAGKIVVQAETINPIQFSYECPFCYSRTKKDGNPYARAKPLKHYHGSNGDLSNRTEYRTAHCKYIPREYSSVEFVIQITDATIREKMDVDWS